MHVIFAVVFAIVASTTEIHAQTRSFVLLVDEGLAATGFPKFVVPRFALKHGIRPTIVEGVRPETVAEADLVLAPRDQLVPFAEAGAIEVPRGIFYTEGAGGTTYGLAPVPGSAEAANAQQFAQWIAGEIGQRTVASFSVEGQPTFIPGVRKVVIEKAPEPTGDANIGERLALLHCGRCHVVSEKNRMGGIGSTPSFAAMRSIPGWEDKFLAFWSANPHPSFTQVIGLTEPFDPNKPPHIAPIEMSQDDVDAIFAFAATIEPKDLGAPIDSR